MTGKDLLYNNIIILHYFHHLTYHVSLQICFICLIVTDCGCILVISGNSQSYIEEKRMPFVPCQRYTLLERGLMTIWLPNKLLWLIMRVYYQYGYLSMPTSIDILTYSKWSVWYCMLRTLIQNLYTVWEWASFSTFNCSYDLIDHRLMQLQRVKTLLKSSDYSKIPRYIKYTIYWQTISFVFWFHQCRIVCQLYVIFCNHLVMQIVCDFVVSPSLYTCSVIL